MIFPEDPTDSVRYLVDWFFNNAFFGVALAVSGQVLKFYAPDRHVGEFFHL